MLCVPGINTESTILTNLIHPEKESVVNEDE